MGLRVFQTVFWKRKRQLKMTVDEATCRAFGKVFGGASGKQKVRAFGILRQRYELYEPHVSSNFRHIFYDSPGLL